MQNENCLPLSNEDALAIRCDMTDVQTFEVSGSDLYAGYHPEHGQILLFVPVLGESILYKPITPQ